MNKWRDAACWDTYRDGIDFFGNLYEVRKYAELCVGCPVFDDCDKLARESFAEFPRFFKGLWAGKHYGFNSGGRRVVRDLLNE